MKKIIFFILFTGLTSIASAQSSLFGMSYQMSFGTGETGDYIANTSFRGMEMEGRWFIDDLLTVGVGWNWSVFYEELKGVTVETGNLALTGNQYRYINAFPFLVTAHHYFSEDMDVPNAFVGLGAGAFRVLQRTSMGIYSIENKSWNFGLVPEAGVTFPVSFNTWFKVSLKYNHAFKTSETIDYTYFSLNVGFLWGE